MDQNEYERDRDYPLWITDGTSSDWPYCERCAAAKCDELNGSKTSESGDPNA